MATLTPISCLLCQGLQPPDDKEVFLNHVRDQHRVFSGMEVVVEASGLQETEIELVIEFITSLKEKRNSLEKDKGDSVKTDLNSSDHLPIEKVNDVSFSNSLVDTKIETPNKEFESMSQEMAKIKKAKGNRMKKRKLEIKSEETEEAPGEQDEIKNEDNHEEQKDTKVFAKKRGTKKGSTIQGKLDKKSKVILGNCKCPLCNQVFCITDFHSERNYRNHVFCHGVRRFNCECEKTWETQRSLKLHVYIAHRGNFHCTTCRIVLQTEEELEIHMKRHVRNDPFVCVDCGYTTLRDSNFNSHVKYYHDTEVHICEICSKEFTGRLKMGIHKRRFHAKKNPCQICGRVVKSLWLHNKNMHTDDTSKRYQCDVCAKGFIEKGKLEIHMTSVHIKNRPFQCRFNCGFASNEKGNRKKHEVTKHGNEWQLRL